MNILTWLYLPTAFLIGMVHALEPGHSKTVVAAYLIGFRGTRKSAMLLGLTVTFTHTMVIFLLALCVLLLGSTLPLEKIQHWLEIVSAVLVSVMGLWLTRYRIIQWARDRKHRCMHNLLQDHDHEHGHSHEITNGSLSLRQLVSFGFSGGLIPCPTALALFILAVGVGKPVLGLVTVVVFSLGLAITLIVIGLAVCGGYSLFEKETGNGEWVKSLPILSSLVVTLLGAAMLIQAIIGHGHGETDLKKSNQRVNPIVYYRPLSRPLIPIGLHASLDNSFQL